VEAGLNLQKGFTQTGPLKTSRILQTSSEIGEEFELEDREE
jgi:hypothetical protein